jgi:mannose-6-phosphate isomerase-like protein (cupin superfamily)
MGKDGDRMGLSHATCMPGGISMPLVRRTMSEDFYIVSGQGEFVLNDGTREIKFEAKPGTYFANPSGMHIQFRNTGNVPLTMLVPTFPPYDVVIPFPGETEYPDFQSRLTAYFKRTDEEIHKTHGQEGSAWNLPEYKALVEASRNTVSDLLKTGFGHEQAAQDLVNPVAKYLHRYFIIKLSDKSAFISQKEAIASDEKENWGLRKAAREALSK